MAESARQKRMRELGVKGSTSPSSSVSSREQRKIELGVSAPSNTSTISARDRRKMELGVIPNTIKQEGEKQVASFKQSEQQFGHVSADPSQSSLMQKANQYADDHPTWNGVVDNPIGRTAGEFLGAIGDGIEKAKEITGLDRVQGAVRGLSTAPLPTHKADGTYLGEYKAAAQNAVESVSNMAKSTAQGFLHPKEADKKFGEIVDKGLEKTNPVTRFAGKMIAESGTDPTSYIPIPIHTIVKGFKNLPSSVSTALDRFASRNSPMADFAPEVPPTLALPPASAESMAAYAKRNGNVLPTNETPIYGKGDVHTFALNESNTPRIINDIKQQAVDLIKPPTSRRGLINYVSQHLEVPKEEVIKLTEKDLYEVGQGIRKTTNMDQLHAKIAAEQGHNWDELLSGKSVTGNVEAPLNRIQVVKPKTNPEIVGSPKQNVEPTVTPQVIRSTEVLPDQKIKGQALKDLKTGDELKFAQTVKSSENTAPELIQKLNEQPQVGYRTTDVLNRQEAAKMIEKHGTEGLYTKLLAKTKQFNASETTAAQILAKHFSSMGGKENLSKAIELVSKTAKGGREMGQAIQALSQWDKLDETGALLLGERQLNKGVTNINEWKKLSTEQAAPIQEAAQRHGTAAETKSLADEVLNIVTNKAQGEALTEAEKATIKQFQDQVKLINEKGKGILSKPKVDKVNETIKEVSQIEPKARTRDQVVSFLDAKAAKARQRIAASRNIGFAAVNKGNPAIDYAIIGASHIAKGVVKLSDFTEVMVRDFGNAVKPHINEAFNKATNMFRKENGLPTVEQLDRVVNAAVKNERFTAEEAKQFKAWASEIGYMSDEFKREATQDLQMVMKELGDSTIGDKIATIETGAMLLNPVTFERNLLGNASQFLQDKVSKLGSVPFDMVLSVLTKGERTIVLKPMNQEKFWQNWWIGTKSGWRGVSPTGMLESYDVHPNVFKKNNPFKYITKSLGASLQGFDYAFYSANKGDVLATYAEQLGKAQGLSRLEIKKGMKELILKLDDRIHDLADEAGKYATYQDETMLAKGAEALKRGFNYPTDFASKKLVDAGMNSKYSLEGYGLGTLVVKFAKTPANLVMRGLDFSPVGFIRAAYELAPLVLNKSKFNQFQASRALGRAITGSLGLTGMGYVLADAGILSGSYSLDKDKRSIEEQSGQGSYKVNWSALERFITSGFDYKEAKTQEGDRMMDYAWLQPMAISIAMGVNANKAVKEMSLGEATNGWKAAGSALMGSLATVLENPMVQGLSNVVDATTDLLKNKKVDKFTDIVKGVPARFIPTVLNQARTSMDNNQRETFDKDLLTEIGNLMKNKVPGLAGKLPISYDSLGNARERIQGGKENTVGQYLTAFFSPARMTEYQVSEEAKLVLDLMDQSGDANVLPRIADKYFKVKQGKNEKDLKVNLDAKQFSQLQKNLGEMVKAKLTQKSTYLSNPDISLEHKVTAVKKILTEVGAKARENLGTEMGYKKKDIKS